MFTILWLIKSFQKDDSYGNDWEFNWFISILLTTLTVLLDLIIIKTIFEII
jgi:hypothetical protein